MAVFLLTFSRCIYLFNCLSIWDGRRNVSLVCSSVFLVIGSGIGVPTFKFASNQSFFIVKRSFTAFISESPLPTREKPHLVFSIEMA
ncbi:hypothetical protein GZH82_12210 [Staphylococcus ursi]|nr:hypothetical protein GZH82_12210 [Staphylococcus sp. MI 10-1553]